MMNADAFFRYIHEIPSIPAPRYLSDPDYFLVGELLESVIFSDGPVKMWASVGTEVFVEVDQLESRDGTYLQIHLGKNFHYVSRVLRRSVSPA